ncbi:MAG: metal-binding protein [Bacteroidia bacterium]|nr:metal-binding protein [Bacteroidia bacterium]
MWLHEDLPDRELQRLICTGQITFGGNRNLGVYGLLTCISGRRMKKANRIFFSSASEATAHGYRPCAHCLRAPYRAWQTQQKSG